MSLLPAASSCCDPCGNGTRTVTSISDLINDAINDNLGIFNVVFYGADNDGVADSTDAIQDAIDAASAVGGIVYFPNGAYRITSQLTFSDTVTFLGTGRDSVTIDASTVTTTAILGTGTMSVLPALSGNIVVGQLTITFTAAHNLAARDIFVLENTIDGSFNDARTIYHDGEWFEVAEVLSATQVRLTQPTYSAYTAGPDISIWKVAPVHARFQGMTMRFRTGLGANISGIQVSLGRNIHLTDLDLSGSQYAQAFIDRCFGIHADHCHFHDTNTTIGNNYGIAIANTQHIRLSNLSGRTLRHVITIGGGSDDGAVPNRDIQLIGGDFGAAGDSGGAQWAVDFHGNCEHYQVLHVDSKSGLLLGGDNGQVLGGFFGNTNDSGYCIAFGEMCGLNFNIEGPTCYANHNFANGLMSLFGRTNVKRVSTLDIKQVKLAAGSFTGSPSALTVGLDLGLIGQPQTNDITVNIEGGSFSTDQTTAGNVYSIRYITTSALGAFKQLRIQNFDGGGAGFSLHGDVRTAIVTNNILPNALRYGIHVALKAAPLYATRQDWAITANQLQYAQRDGILFEGSATYTNLVCNRNAAFNCSQEAAATYTSINIDGALNVEATGNDIGDNQASATQASQYRTANITNLTEAWNRNLGLLVNPALVIARVSVTNLRDDPPIDGPQWDWTVDSYNWGTTGATAVLPYNFRRDSNNFVQWFFANRPAAGNTSAGMGLGVAAGTTSGSNNASGVLAAWPQDYTLTYRQGKFGPEANSDADALLLAATAASQRIDCYAGSTTLTFQLDASATASHTRMLVYDVDSGLLQRVKAGANGTGPGGTGRALYIDNV